MADRVVTASSNGSGCTHGAWSSLPGCIACDPTAGAPRLTVVAQPRPTHAADVAAALGRTAPQPVARPSTRAGATTEQGRARSRVVDGAAFILDQPAHPPALWGDGSRALWTVGESLMLVGPTGVGKTTVAGQLVRGRLGLQADLLDLPIRPGNRRVLYLAMDRPPQIARSLARLFTEADRQVLTERLAVEKGPPPADLARNPDVLCQLARQHDADTVVIDSLKDAALELSKDDTGSGYNRARQAALADGVELVELHHQRKASADNRKPAALDDVFGSTWLTAGAGSVCLLWGSAGDLVIELIHLKQPAEQIGPLRLLHNHVSGLTTVWAQLDVLDVARRHPRGVSAVDLARLMFDTGTPKPGDVEKARRRLESHTAAGRLHKMPARGGGEGGSEPVRYVAVTAAEEL